MAPFDLVVHHRYASGDCADLSGHANHGYPTATTTTPDGIEFDGHNSRIVVFPSPTLTDFGGIRVRARMRLDEYGDRRTIMEGYLSFSFSVEHDGSLAGSIYTGLQWHALTTAPGLVRTQKWVDVTFTYDGRDSIILTMDGSMVAARYVNAGTVDGVHWPYGLNIGAWPDQDARVFSGTIAELWLWRLGPPTVR